MSDEKTDNTTTKGSPKKSGKGCQCLSPLEVYSIQHYVIKFISDLRQVGGFLRIHQLPSPIKLTATI